MSLNFGTNVSDRVDCGSAAILDDLPSSTNGFTVLSITKRTGTGANQQIVTKFQNTTTSSWNFLVDNAPSEGVTRFLILRPGGTHTDYITSTVTHPVDQWTFAAGTFKNGDTPAMSIYHSSMNAEVSEASYNTSTNGSGALTSEAAANLYIGNLQLNTNTPFKGDIGIVAVVNRKMTLAECKDWKGNPRMIAGCIGFWRLGENGTGTQPDYSGNANAGTVTGATVSANPPISRPYRQLTLVTPTPPANYLPLIGGGLINSRLTQGRLVA